ncbi:hypothetical protein [Streptomyces aureocirculatus]|uniref:hypothetical protein n=1 Tax=Streptomyces aureocirculatus TaxID=67275 RepID=UPI000689ADD8|nr:hypothetical protein [Streptomyces aureocirculatus]
MDRRHGVRRTALLLTVAYALGLLPGHAGAAPAPPPSGSPHRPAAATRGCSAADLPSTAPVGAAPVAAARAVLACLDTAVPGGTAPRGARLRAAALTVTALYCPPGGDVCRAESVALHGVRLAYPGTAGRAGSCFSARRISLSGHVRFRAARLSGRAFGLLPLTLSTTAVPPVPVPHLHLTGVDATGLWSRADHATSARTAITPGGQAGNCVGR